MEALRPYISHLMYEYKDPNFKAWHQTLKS